VVSFDGKGVPMIKEEAVSSKAKLAREKAAEEERSAWWGSATRRSKPLSPEALGNSGRAGSGSRAPPAAGRHEDDAPRAQQVGRRGQPVQTKQEVMECIKPTLSAGTRRTGNLGRPARWRPLPVRLATSFSSREARDMCAGLMHVVGYLWSAANALFGEQSKAGRLVQQEADGAFRGRVGDVNR